MTQEIKDIIFNAMEEQQVNHRPIASLIEDKDKNMLSRMGGIARLCDELGIKSKKEYNRLIEQGKYRLLLIQTQLKLEKEAKKLEDNRRMMRIY